MPAVNCKKWEQIGGYTPDAMITASIKDPAKREARKAEFDLIFDCPECPRTCCWILKSLRPLSKGQIRKIRKEAEQIRMIMLRGAFQIVIPHNGGIFVCRRDDYNSAARGIPGMAQIQ